ncbi:MAG TPA: hypothetical protein VFI74_05630 [Candidatus Saccharimonadales bacterium]|nr:hypothetical protein [Candidatus Saccharimonadales bacterium]
MLRAVTHTIHTWIRRHAEVFVYGAAALLILGPLLRRGFVFAADMVFVPWPPMPHELLPSYPYELLLHVLSTHIPADILQKSILFATLLLAGLGMHRLTRLRIPKADSRAIYLFAGLLYMVNPFVYSRYMIGQYLIVAGYALLPWCISSFWKLTQKPKAIQATIAGFWLSAVAIFSVHMFGIALMAVTVFAVFEYVKHSQKRLLLQAIALYIGVTATATVYWWLPVVLGSSALQQTTQGFSKIDAAAFATAGTWWGVIGNVLSLQGFWADTQNLYQTSRNVFWWWMLPVGALWAMAIIGARQAKRQALPVLSPLLVVMAVGCIFAIGTSATIFASLNGWMVQHVPFFAGYREPQKFVALLCIGYALFGALGLQRLLALAKQGRDILITAALALPCMLAPLMPWGFASQLKTHDYPRGWYESRSYIKERCSGECRVLFLPWHLYMHYDFAERIIANPAPKFFGGNVIASTDPEIKGATPYTWTYIQQRIGAEVLPSARQGGHTFARDLATLNVQYIVLTNDIDDDYAFIERQEGIVLVKNTPSVKIYRVENRE